ncbi:MAG: sialate O-acetylesterase, partial [Ekhidna sp.]|nr:sialate O-acetylesterase [Ekhidna sp.]
ITINRDFSVVQEERLSAGSWVPALGKQIYDFSATAYFFGKGLHQELEVPIGLIVSCWGGTNVEAWMSRESLDDYPVLDSIYLAQKENLLEENIKQKEAKLLTIVDQEVRNGIGLDEKWFKPAIDWTEWSDMVIPMQKGNQLFTDMDGAVWLKKKFEVPTPFRGRDLKFNLGQFDDYDKVWINGQEVGETSSKRKWRNYVAKKEILKVGLNEITIRVFDYSGDGGWITDPYFINMHPVGDRKAYFLLSGDWKYKVGKVLENPLDMPKIPSSKNRIANTIPSSLYNQMINPLIDLPISGAIWYQGESNSVRGYEYSKYFPRMISSWRSAFDQGDFPFYFVQLPNFQGKSRGPNGEHANWAELRAAQTKALELGNTGMAVALDLGLGENIHPPNKEDVGRRLALTALGDHYQRQVSFQSPTFKSLKVERDRVYISFSEVGEGLKNSNDTFTGPLLNHFEVAGSDGNFYSAKAKISDLKTVEVWSSEVSNPVQVRYAWKNNPENINFYGSNDMPVAPFHTGDWEWETRENTYLKSLDQ